MKASAELNETVSGGELPKPFQIESYEGLLQFPRIPDSSIDTPSGKRATTEPLVDAIIDAIVVSNFRSAEHLRPAIQFAAAARCYLIAVYTDSPPSVSPMPSTGSGRARSRF